MEPSYGFWCRHTGSAGMARPHAHCDLEWNYLLRGRFGYRTGDGEVVLQPGCLTLFWAGIGHRSVGQDAELIIGVLPWERLLAWGLPMHTVQRLLAGAFLTGPLDCCGDDERLLRRWCDDFDSGHPRRRELVDLEVQARFRRLLADVAPDAGPARLSPAVRALLQAISSAHGDGRSITALATDLGYHPKRLGTDFRRQTGLSPGRLQRALRIAAAQRLLLTRPESTLAGVARRAGFGSTAAFHAAFKTAVGSSPDAWRRSQACADVD